MYCYGLCVVFKKNEFPFFLNTTTIINTVYNGKY